MASTPIETVDSAAVTETLTRAAAGRALNRRNFMTALSLAGTAAGAALTSARSTPRPSVVQAVGPGQPDVLNFALNLEYLEATFYSYITQGVDLPASLTVGSGAITGNPTAKLVFTGPNAAQITDLLNEIYYDELNHVIDLRNALGSTVAVARPALNLAAYTAITANNALSLARVFEDVGVTAYAGAANALSGSNLTYAAQILAVEGFHAGALRLTAIQNPALAPNYVTSTSTATNVTFTGSVTAGSNTMQVYFLSATAITTGSVVTGPGLQGFPTITAINGALVNSTTTGTYAAKATVITAVASLTGLAVGQVITGSGIAANTTITAITPATNTLTISIATTAAGTAAALTIGTTTFTLSIVAASTQAVQTYIVGDNDTMDVAPYDPGSATLAAAGPTAAGGFFATSGGSSANAVTPAGLAFVRTTSQVLSIVYASAGVAPVAGTTKGGFFPNGMNGVINTI